MILNEYLFKIGPGKSVVEVGGKFWLKVDGFFREISPQAAQSMMVGCLLPRDPERMTCWSGPGIECRICRGPKEVHNESRKDKTKAKKRKSSEVQKSGSEGPLREGSTGDQAWLEEIEEEVI